MLYPFLMKSDYKDYIWGGRNLERFGKRLGDCNVAEAWEVSARADGESRIANGYWAGKGLGNVIEINPEHILGKAVMSRMGHRLSLLFKLIDANDKLSVQVHPDDAYAKAVENEPNGKHEAWYILEAAPNAQIVYGLLPGTSREDFRQMVENNRISDCLNTVRVKPGDVIDIPPGTVHAICKGIVLAEIQQNSNITYRLYDFDRKNAMGKPRELHINKALGIIDYSSRNPFATGMIWDSSENAKITQMLRNRYFQLNILDIYQTLELNTEGDRFYILFVARGGMCISSDSGELSVKKGDTIFLPAALGRYAITGECRLLEMHVPTEKETI